MTTLLAIFLALGIVAFAIFILRALGGAASQVRPALWVVLGVLILGAYLSGRQPEPLRPAMCGGDCRLGFAGVETEEQRATCLEVCSD